MNDASAESQPRRLGKTLGEHRTLPMTVYREDLEEMIRLLSSLGPNVAISTETHGWDSLSQLASHTKEPSIAELSGNAPFLHRTGGASGLHVSHFYAMA